MSNNSSFLPGNTENSNSLSQDSDVSQMNIMTPSSPPCSQKLLQTANSPPHGTGSIQNIPPLADSIFVWYLNQGRWEEQLSPDPYVQRKIDSNTLTKLAVLSVLSTNCWLCVNSIRKQLAGMSYQRSKDSIRLALQRCAKFGLAYKRRSFRRTLWALTATGRELINKPRNPDMSTEKEIHNVLSTATDWVSVAGLRAYVKVHRDTIRRALRRNPAYKSEKIPGGHGARRWALATADTSGWTNPAPTIAATAPTTSISKPINFATYGGMTLMCSPSDKPSLIRAVGDLLVNEFVTTSTKFSAHDVTKRLREIELSRAKNATRIMPISIPSSYPVDKAETGEVHVVGYRIPKIEHEDVKNIVHDIYSAGGMPGIGRLMNNGHMEYMPEALIDSAINLTLGSNI